MTFFALSSLGVGLVIFSELSATVMIGGVLVIGIFGHFNFIYVSYLIVLIEAVFAFIEKVVVALTGKVDKNTSSKSILIFCGMIFKDFFNRPFYFELKLKNCFCFQSGRGVFEK